MALPILVPWREYFGAVAEDAGWQATILIVTSGLGVAALGLLVAGGLVALSGVFGFALAACAFAAGFGISALVVHLIGRRYAVRRAMQITAMRRRATAEIAVSVMLNNPARPLLPFAAFIAAFVYARWR